MSVISLPKGNFNSDSVLSEIRALLQDREEPIETLSIVDAFDMFEKDTQGRWAQSVVDRIHLVQSASEKKYLLLASRAVFETLIHYSVFVNIFLPALHREDMERGFLGEAAGAFLLLLEDEDLVPSHNLYICECDDDAVQAHLQKLFVSAANPITIPVSMLTRNWRQTLETIPPNLYLSMD